MAVDFTTLQPPAKPDSKTVWGFDPDLGEWVPVDRSMAEGSFIGNLGRAAARGFEDVGRGIMLEPSDPRREAEQAAASRGAPWAETLGGFAPEAAGAGLAATFTGGLSIPAALVIEGLGAGAVSAARPGNFEDRILRGAVSAVETAIGGAAARGIMASLRVGQGVLSGTTKRIADGVEAGAQRVRTSEVERAAVEAEARQAAAAEAGGAVPEAGAGGAQSAGAAATPVPEGGAGGAQSAGAAATPVPEAGAGGAQSAGAAATPESLLGDEYGQMSRALQRTEQAGADLSEDATMQRMRTRADELGIRMTPGAGSRGMSPARLAQAAHEMNPFGDIVEQQIRAGNQSRVAELLHNALGSDNPKGSLLYDDLAIAEQRVGERFDYVESRMPMMPQKQLGEALGNVQQVRGVAGRSRGQKFVDDAIDEINKRGGDMMTPAEWMDTRRTFQGEMARLYAQGDTTGGDAIAKAVEKMDRLAEQRFRRSGRDRLANYWERSRRQYQVLMAAKRSGAISPTGDVNIKTLLNGLKRERSSGGFGQGGPARGTPERDLFDALRIVAHGESGVPMTGARMLIQKGLRSTAGKVGVTAIGGGLLGTKLF